MIYQWTDEHRRKLASRLYRSLQQEGKYDVLKLVQEKDLLLILNIELGGSKYKNNHINSSGFAGPLQVGHSAWKDSIHLGSKYSGSITKAEFRTLCLAGGGPCDVDVLANGYYHYCNNSVKYFIAAGGSKYLARVKRRPASFLYLLHNQGPGGAIHYLRTGKLKFPMQSRDAVTLISLL